MILPTTVVSVLSATVLNQQYPNDVHNLIQRLNEFYRFDYNILIVDFEIDLNRWFPMSPSNFGNKFTDNFTPQSVYTFDDYLGSDFNETERPVLEIIRAKNTLLVAAVQDLMDRSGSKVLENMKAMQKIDKNVKIAVFITRNIFSLDIVERLFHWSWSIGIVNIFCAFYLAAVDDGTSAYNVFKYDAFCEFDLVNLTQSESLPEYFPNDIPNYCRHPLRLQSIQGFTDSHKKREFWDAVVRVFNATVLVKPVTRENYFRYGREDVDVHFYEVSLGVSALDKHYVYPFRLTKLVLIVPHAQPYSDFAAY